MPAPRTLVVTMLRTQKLSAHRPPEPAGRCVRRSGL